MIKMCTPWHHKLGERSREEMLIKFHYKNILLKSKLNHVEEELQKFKVRGKKKAQEKLAVNR